MSGRVTGSAVSWIGIGNTEMRSQSRIVESLLNSRRPNLGANKARAGHLTGRPVLR
jgi:hypothetical protein